MSGPVAASFVILGGTRFIGPPLVRRLAGAGHDVTIFHRGQNPLVDRDGVREVLGDRSEIQRHESEIFESEPSVAIDMMAYTEEGARAAVAVLNGRVDRVVLISSADVYRSYDRLRGIEDGEAIPGPLDENAPLRDRLYPYRDAVQDESDWRHHYDKIVVEKVYLELGRFSTTVLRLPMVYGPRDFQHRLHPYLKRMDDGRPSIALERGQPEWRVTRGYVENVAAAVKLAASNEGARDRIYNVGEPYAWTEHEWIEKIASRAGWRGTICVVDAATLPEAMRSELDWRHPLALDTSRMRRELGYREEITLDDALDRTIAWERGHPPEWNPAAFDYEAEDRARGPRGGAS